MALGSYKLLLRLGLPFVALWQWWRHRGEIGRHANWKEFFGRYSERSLRSIVWLHSASAVDARAAASLAHALQKEFPEHDVLVTSSTPEGREALHRACGGKLRSAYLPYDLPGTVERFLAHFGPRLGIMVGIEVRPVLMSACRLHGVPMVLANARLSRDLARSHARFGTLSRPAIGLFETCCAQDRASARRLQQLGARHLEQHLHGVRPHDNRLRPPAVRVARVAQQSLAEPGSRRYFEQLAAAVGR